ncbi:hypothetical protein KY345_03375 [Candidatus Woesearchaeota archaeon]|nr:hypothetical protein [Candidatus Woesearchaeota archaeon]
MGNDLVKKLRDSCKLFQDIAEYGINGDSYGICVPFESGEREVKRYSELIESYGLEKVVPVILQSKEQNLKCLRAIGAEEKVQPYVLIFEGFAMFGETGEDNIIKELEYIKEKKERLGNLKIA